MGQFIKKDLILILAFTILIILLLLLVMSDYPKNEVSIDAATETSTVTRPVQGQLQKPGSSAPYTTASNVLPTQALPVSTVAGNSAAASPSLKDNSTPASALPLGQEDGGWISIFDEEFNGAYLDLTRWSSCYWWDTGGCTNAGNNELEWYQPDDVLLKDGSLNLKAEKRLVTANDEKSYNYTSGMISTGPNDSDKQSLAKFAFRYGYTEMRAKIPVGKSLWPSFWLLPAENHEWPPEIDVMELVGDEPNIVHMTVHFLDVNGKESESGWKWTGPDFSTGFHTFAIDWKPEAIIWYVDGIERFRFQDIKYIPHEKMYLIVNLAVGGDWPGNPDANTIFPSYFEVDYVRVWQKPGIN